MDEYINRDDLLKAAWDNPTLSISVYDIGNIKPADVAPVRHGKWRYYHKQNIAVCTECSFERNLDANFGRAVSCPNCGAKMDGGAD